MEFAITFDYLCPFARNTNEAVLTGIAQGAAWDAEFVPFSLAQVHLGEDDPPVWERPEARSGVLALQWAIAVRDGTPDRFPDLHRELFAARHDRGRDINDEAVVREAAAAAGVEVEEVARIVATGSPLETLGREHTKSVEDHGVFGVPTIIVGGEAVFVRMMERDRVDDLERVLDMIGWTRLNELKRTRIPR